MNFFVYLIAMAGVTYLIRMIPFAAFRKQIKSRFIKSILYYLPYAVLAAMTVPAIFYSTGNLKSAVVGTVVAVVVAFFEKPLLIVALAAAASGLITDLII